MHRLGTQTIVQLLRAPVAPAATAALAAAAPATAAAGGAAAEAARSARSAAGDGGALSPRGRWRRLGSSLDGGEPEAGLHEPLREEESKPARVLGQDLAPELAARVGQVQWRRACSKRDGCQHIRRVRKGRRISVVVETGHNQGAAAAHAPIPPWKPPGYVSCSESRRSKRR